MRSLSRTFLCSVAILSTSSCSAFAPAARPMTTSSLNLVPSQAKELEACAYDLMKEAITEKASSTKEATMNLSKDISAKFDTHHHNGPVRWARQRLWPSAEEKKETSSP